MFNILRFKQLLVTTALLLASVSSFAYDFEVDGIYYNILSDSTVEVTYKDKLSGHSLKKENGNYAEVGNNSYSGSVIIPSEIKYAGNEYSVVAIGEGAFSKSNDLISITLPSTISSIKLGAFYCCEGLVSIEIPNRVVSIGRYAFSWCSGLTSINIPDGISSIDIEVFAACRGLSSIQLPKSLVSIGVSAFSSCSSLTSIILPNGLTSIGDRAFMYCNSLKSITIPNGVTCIGERAFENCSDLNSVNIGSGVTTIGTYAFCECKSLTSITIPGNVHSIGYGAFQTCGLTSIKMLEGVSEIGACAFFQCYGLTSVNIPSTIISIGTNAFESCRNLIELNICDVKSWIGIKHNGQIGLSSYTLILNGLNLTDLIIPDDDNYIGMYSFYGCTSLESITLHKNITAIAQNAFNGCSNVKKIVCQGDTPPACGAKALEGISRTECTLYVPETSGSNYKNTAPWSEFTNIVGGGTETPDTPKTCEAPTITFDNDTKELCFTSATEGATYKYTITSDDMASEASTSDKTQLTGVYTITAYASAEGMYNSEKTTAKLCWLSAAIESDEILSAKADRGVIVSSNANQINISGTVNGETIEVYNVGGSKLKSVNATGNNTTINGLQSGNVYIIKIGGTKVKVAM